MLHNSQIRKQPIKEKVREAQETVYADLKLRFYRDVCQLCFELPQLLLKLFHLLLCVVQLLILGKICQQAAAQYVPSAPTLCAVQCLKNLTCGVQSRFSGVCGFPDLPELSLPRPAIRASASKSSCAAALPDSRSAAAFFASAVSYTCSQPSS